MAAALALSALGACVAPALPERAAAARGPLAVTNGGQPFAFDQGAEARAVAERSCAAQGQRLRPSIYDRFDRATGAWVYPGGCA